MWCLKDTIYTGDNKSSRLKYEQLTLKVHENYIIEIRTYYNAIRVD